MIRLWEFLLQGCWHKWITIEEFESFRGDRMIGQVHVCRCERCGRPARFNLD